MVLKVKSLVLWFKSWYYGSKVKYLRSKVGTGGQKLDVKVIHAYLLGLKKKRLKKKKKKKNKILQKQDDASAHVKYCFAGEKRKFKAKKGIRENGQNCSK